MRGSTIRLFGALFVLFALIAGGDTWSAIAEAQPFSAEELARRTVERRVVEAVIWGMPAVNYDLMFQAAVRAKGNFNQVIYWSRLPDWKIQTLTPNPDAIYLTPFINTKDVGPVVLEIPPADAGSITGTVMDLWQSALEDVGPAGMDNGRGGKYVILPPGYKAKLPTGYIPLPSDTYQGYALLRSIPMSGSPSDIAKAVAYGKRITLYPLSQAATPPATTFIDVVNIVYDATITYDPRFFESLNRIVQAEPWLERDKAMIDQLTSIGIEKGKPFNPDPRTRDVLDGAAREAHALLVAQCEASFASPYYESSHWARPGSRELLEGQATFFAKPDVYPVDLHGVMFSYVYFSPKHLNAGSSYLLTIADKNGRLLDGGTAYRLTVPTNAPPASIGRRRSTTAPPMHQYETPDGRVARLVLRDCKRTLMGRLTSISDPLHQSVRIPTGFPPAPMAASKFYSAFTAPSGRCSIRRGSCRISRT